MTAKDNSTPAGLPIFERDAKGKIAPTRANLLAAVSAPDICAHAIYWGPPNTCFVGDLGHAFAVPIGEEKSNQQAYALGPDWVPDDRIYQMAMILEEFGFRDIPARRLEEAIIFRVNALRKAK